MSPTRALQVVLFIALIGLAFSGTLTYNEIFASAPGCPAPGAKGTLFGYPACVYGFFMYLVITVVTALGLRGAHHARPALAGA